jgi:hypothetical protein
MHSLGRDRFRWGRADRWWQHQIHLRFYCSGKYWGYQIRILPLNFGDLRGKRFQAKKKTLEKKIKKDTGSTVDYIDCELNSMHTVALDSILMYLPKTTGNLPVDSSLSSQNSQRETQLRHDARMVQLFGKLDEERVTFMVAWFNSC